jgi:hypothetical protein
MSAQMTAPLSKRELFRNYFQDQSGGYILDLNGTKVTAS